MGAKKLNKETRWQLKSINLPKTIMEEYGMKTKVKIRILFQSLLI